MGSEKPTARALESVQHAAPRRRKYSRLSDQQLDRARHLALHRQRKTRGTTDLLCAPTRDHSARLQSRAGLAIAAAEAWRESGNRFRAVSTGGRHDLYLPGSID